MSHRLQICKSRVELPAKRFPSPLGERGMVERNANVALYSNRPLSNPLPPGERGQNPQRCFSKTPFDSWANILLSPNENSIKIA